MTVSDADPTAASSQPLVSVHLISYNQRLFIEASLDSVLAQDYENLEIIAGDDASTDGTADVIRAYAAKYPGKVIPLVAETNGGVTENCNRTLHACRGKYIAFFAGDDLMMPGKIRAQVAWLEQDPRRVLCGHDIVLFDSESGRDLFISSDYLPLLEGAGPAVWVRLGTIFGGLAMMVRASAVPPTGFDVRLPVTSDWKFWIDCLAGGGLYGYVPGLLARYRKHPGSVTARSKGDERHHQASLIEMLTTLSFIEAEHSQLLGDVRIGRARVLYGEGVWLFAAGRMVEARRYLRTGARLHWRWALKAAVWWLLSYFPKPLRMRLLGGTRRRM